MVELTVGIGVRRYRGEFEGSSERVNIKFLLWFQSSGHDKEKCNRLKRKANMKFAMANVNIINVNF